MTATATTAPAPVIDGTLRIRGCTPEQWAALVSIANELGVPVSAVARERAGVS